MSTIGALRWISSGDKSSATTANIVSIFNLHNITSFSVSDNGCQLLYIITFLEKDCIFLPFWTQISYCIQVQSVIQLYMYLYMYRRLVLLSSYRTPSWPSVFFFFVFYVLFEKNIWITPKCSLQYPIGQIYLCSGCFIITQSM